MGVVCVGVIGGGGGGARQDGRSAALFDEAGIAGGAGIAGARMVAVGVVGEEFLFEAEEGALAGVFGDLALGDLLAVLDGVGGLVGLVGLVGAHSLFHASFQRSRHCGLQSSFGIPICDGFIETFTSCIFRAIGDCI